MADRKLDNYKKLAFYKKNTRVKQAGFSKFESDGGYYFCRWLGGQIVLISQSYSSETGRDNGVESVKKNAKLKGRYSFETRAGEKHGFSLKAGNGQEIAVSPGFANLRRAKYFADRMSGSMKAKPNAVKSTLAKSSSPKLKNTQSDKLSSENPKPVPAKPKLGNTSPTKTGLSPVKTALPSATRTPPPAKTNPRPIKTDVKTPERFTASVAPAVSVATSAAVAVDTPNITASANSDRSPKFVSQSTTPPIVENFDEEETGKDLWGWLRWVLLVLLALLALLCLFFVLQEPKATSGILPVENLLTCWDGSMVTDMKACPIESLSETVIEPELEITDTEDPTP